MTFCALSEAKGMVIMMNEICILSQQKFSKKHVSQDTIEAFENALQECESHSVTKLCFSEFIFKVNRKLSKQGISRGVRDYKLLSALRKLKPNYIFLMAMSYETLEYQLMTLRHIKTKKIIYCVDTWYLHLDKWKQVLKEINADIVLCSNKATVKEFKKFIDKVYYLPYSMNEKWFYPRNNAKKTHLFMQMGRKNTTLHEFILKYIEENGLSDADYIREKQRGQIIFPVFNQLAEEINKTKFFVLAPRDVDESEITGAISDVTARFYEGMACKTLLIGYKPKDTFDELFPYEHAMISVENYNDFKTAVDYYLAHEEEYEQIVEKNYEYLIAHHRWKNRVETLFQYIEKRK